MNTPKFMTAFCIVFAAYSWIVAALPFLPFINPPLIEWEFIPHTITVVVAIFLSFLMIPLWFVEYIDSKEPEWIPVGKSFTVGRQKQSDRIGLEVEAK